MGADLYMRADGKLAESQVYGVNYFRDSYNATSLLWALGLSWWQDIAAMLDESRNLTPQNAEKLLAMIESRQLPSPEALVQTEGFRSAVVDRGKNSPDAWWQMLEKKQQVFAAFLRKAIDTGASIWCSV